MLKIIVTAQDERQDVKKKNKKRGKRKEKKKNVLQVICQGEKRIFLDLFPFAVTLTYFTQKGAQGRGAPTVMAGLALAPGMLEMPPLEGHCFPQVFISAAAGGRAGISLPEP